MGSQHQFQNTGHKTNHKMDLSSQWHFAVTTLLLGAQEVAGSSPNMAMAELWIKRECR